MRLINADDIKYTDMLAPMGNGNYEHVGIVTESDIDALPTVEAIPISFIKKFEKHCEDHDDWLANHEWSNHFDAPVISRLLEKWREENETNKR